MSDQEELFQVTEAKRPSSVSREESPSPTGDSYEATGFEPDDEHPLRARSRLPIETCDCCGGKTKLYRRKLNSGMVATLIWLVAHRGMEWTHTSLLPRRSAQSNEISKLELWGFVEQRHNTDSAKRTSGIWKATAAGKDFALRKARAASHVYVLSPGQEVLGWEPATTNVVEALGGDFNYHELMRGA